MQAQCVTNPGYSLKKTSLPSLKSLTENDYVHCWTSYRRLRSIVLAMFLGAIVEVRFFLPGIVISATFFIPFSLAFSFQIGTFLPLTRQFFCSLFHVTMSVAEGSVVPFPKAGLTSPGYLSTS